MVRYLMILGMLASTPALSADIYEQPIQASMDWSGIYAGVHMGTISSNGEANRGAIQGPLINLDVQNGLFPTSIDDTNTGFSGGLSVGYNHQFGRFVGGFEADVTFANFNSRTNFSRIDPNPNPIFNGINTITSYQTEFGTFATARLRGGVTYDRTMFFASAGLAVGKVTNRFTLDLPGLGYSSPGWGTDGTEAGFALGVGVEHRVTDRIGLKLEAIGIDLNDTVVHAVDNVTFPGETIDYHFKNQALLARFGVYLTF